ncbi:MAG: 60S ribosomal protein L22 [Candidatus Odinarchaeia archaeon]
MPQKSKSKKEETKKTEEEINKKKKAKEEKTKTEKKGKSKKQKTKENILVLNGEYLSGYNDVFLNELAEFITEKIDGKAKRDGTDILINAKNKAFSKTKLKFLVKKFLHKKEIGDTFKLISLAGKGNTLIIQKRREIIE